MANISRLQPAIKLQVTKVVDIFRAPASHSRAHRPVQSILCDCIVIGTEEQVIRRALLSFGSSNRAAGVHVNPEAIDIDSEVLIWEPWEEVEVSHRTTLLSSRFLVLPKS